MPPRRPYLAPLALALVAQSLFAWRLGVPSIFVFDEVHYVPAARTLLALNGPANIEHPLFGKTLVALGIALFGDNPIGWRALSSVAGTATVLAAYAIAKLLTGRDRPALIAGILTLTGGTVFVQARIAMLDTFMAALLAGGLALLLWALRSERRIWAKWLAGSALLGLAIGTKWAALPYVGFAGAGLTLLWWRRGRRAPLPLVAALAALGAVAGIAYLATFAPAFFYRSDPLTLAGLIPFQAEMYARQTQVLPPHVYQSDWWSWPLLIRPIWYLWQPVDGAQRGILLIANPALAWGGLAAVVACLSFAWRDRSLTLLATAALWVLSVAMWAAIPKSLGFYYYYYPSTIWLAVALAVALDRVDPGGRRRRDEWFAVLSIGLFVFFLPILAAWAQPDAGAFRRWMWFERWI